MENYIGDIIYKSRLADDLTQDEYGAKYSVSGPAIFKFEKGYVRPSLELWLKMAKDAEVNQRRAVLIWLKSKLPAAYKEYVEFQSAAVAEREATYGRGKKKKKAEADYAKMRDRAAMREAATQDESLPKGLSAMLEDDELWSLYKPSGSEVNMLREMFGPLGRGKKSAYREALRLIREFTHSF